MKTFYFSATKGSKKDTLLYKTDPIRFFFKENNTQAIAKVYNRAIDFALENDFEYMVLAHDDIIIESDIEDRLEELFDNKMLTISIYMLIIVIIKSVKSKSLI